MSSLGVNGKLLSELAENAEYSDISMVRKHKPDYLIMLFMGLLMLIGLIVIFAIGPQRANVLNNIYGSSYDGSYFFMKQFISLLVGIAGFVTMTIIPYTFFTKRSFKLLFFLGFGSCLLLAVSSWLGLSIAQQTLGATRWFNLGAFGSLQPAEILKFTMLFFVAGFLGMQYKKGKINDIKKTLLPVAGVLALSALFVIVIQKDFGTGASIIGMVLAMILISKISLRYIGMFFITLFFIALTLTVTSPHRMERILTYFGSSDSGSADSYHIDQAKLAIGSGGLFGVGVGNSVQATGYLPEAINDSVFAIIGETFGFVGLITILALFFGILYRLVVLINLLVDMRLKLLAAGVFGWFGSHVILNVASMTGLIPLTGITLPLLSFGGTSLVFIVASLGLAFQLSRYTVHPLRVKEMQNEDTNSRRGVGRSRHSSRGGYRRD